MILCDWFLPGYLAGGPIRSIETLTQQLGKDLNFRIITTDRDFRSDVAYTQVPANTWTIFEGREVFYVSPENMNSAFILDLISTTPHDVLYLNSLFSRLFTVYPLQWKRQGKIGSHVVLAPRGMLGDGALAIKPLKKKMFLFFSKAFGLFKDVCWQSTSAQETAEIRKRIGHQARIMEVSNLPKATEEANTIEKEPGRLRLCFISRISEKKNLNFALEVLRSINSMPITFDVYGPVEDQAYWEVCSATAKHLPATVTFDYRNSLRPEEIGATLENYHALFLPTQNENYGHIIVEALQHARPVILSDQTPWRNLHEHGVGFDIPLSDKQAFVDAITELVALDQACFDSMSKNCRAYISQKLNTEKIKVNYISLFNA